MLFGLKISIQIFLNLKHHASSTCWRTAAASPEQKPEQLRQQPSPIDAAAARGRTWRRTMPPRLPTAAETLATAQQQQQQEEGKLASMHEHLPAAVHPSAPLPAPHHLQIPPQPSNNAADVKEKKMRSKPWECSDITCST